MLSESGPWADKVNVLTTTQDMDTLSSSSYINLNITFFFKNLKIVYMWIHLGFFSDV